MGKSKVFVLRTTPEGVIEDIARLLKEANVDVLLDKSRPVILKDNISWHLPMPSSNTTPWQLEGTILGLKKLGFEQIVAVENKTVVTKPQKGAQLNKLASVYKKYNVPILYNFEPSHMK
jgi:hypothetical protein